VYLCIFCKTHTTHTSLSHTHNYQTIYVYNICIYIIQTIYVYNICIYKYIQVSKEGDTFEVPTDIAKLSNLVVTTLGEEMEDDDDETLTEIPLPNVKATVLAKVIEYCTYYKNTEASKYHMI